MEVKDVELIVWSVCDFFHFNLLHLLKVFIFLHLQFPLMIVPPPPPQRAQISIMIIGSMGRSLKNIITSVHI